MKDIAPHYATTVQWTMHPTLARSVSQREGVTEKRWAGRAKYRRRYFANR